MTHAELERIEAIFRSPPSTGVLAEHGLALCAALRPYLPEPSTFSAQRLLDDHAVHLAASRAAGLMPPELARLHSDLDAEGARLDHDASAEHDAVPDVGDADPTPPHSPKAKKGKR